MYLDIMEKAGMFKAAETIEDFHKVFIYAGGHFLEFDCNADTNYDASGLGRVHKINSDKLYIEMGDINEL